VTPDQRIRGASRSLGSRRWLRRDRSTARQTNRFGLNRAHELSADSEPASFGLECNDVDLDRVANPERQRSSDNRALLLGQEHERTVFLEMCLQRSRARGCRSARRKLSGNDVLQLDQLFD
jgi:hypothetical protein